LGKGKGLKYVQMPDEVGCWILKPHQQSAIDFFAKRGGRILIGDAWAMGKTVSALAIIKTFAFQTVLIVCP
jgi:superfamily II DNA or RNA helicase